MGWFFGNNSGDGSKMKVTNTPDSVKTERISSKDYPHTHDIVSVDKSSGSVVQISNGENFSTKGGSK